MNDKQLDKLLMLISHGDNAAFERLYDETKKGVFSFIYSYLKNFEDTRDAMQNVYLKIKLNVDKYEQGTNARAWILQIAKNTSINELYRRRKTDNFDDIEIPVQPQNSIGINEVMQKVLTDDEKQIITLHVLIGINEVMQKVLTDDEKQIITLHVLWGFKHREIAKQLNCPVGTVTSKYKRSIAKLKEALKEEIE